MSLSRRKLFACVAGGAAVAPSAMAKAMTTEAVVLPVSPVHLWAGDALTVTLRSRFFWRTLVRKFTHHATHYQEIVGIRMGKTTEAVYAIERKRVLEAGYFHIQDHP